jgi:2'-5' RNA ligase
VAWVGVAGDTARLTALAADVQAACRAAGVSLEPRGFRPHLTVGKTTHLDPGVPSGYVGPGWRVTEFELVQRVLGKSAEHTAIERFPLYQA